MKPVLIVALILTGFSVLAQQTGPRKKVGSEKEQKANGKVYGEIKNMPEQTVVLELLRANDIVTIVDSAHSTPNGHFDLPVFAAEPQLYRLHFASNRFIFLSVNKEKVKVESDWNNFDSYTITGSKASEEIKTFITSFRDNMQRLGIMKTHEDSLKKAGQDSLALAADKNFEQSRADFYAGVRETANKSTYEPNAVLAARLLNPAQEASFLASFEKSLATRFPNTAMTKDFNEFYQKLNKKTQAPQIGEMAPDVSLTSPDGSVVNLSSLKGHYVLLDFWASWCGPCRGENPNVVNAYKRFKDKNFTIYGVSLDNNKEAWQKAINADGLSWTQVSELKGWSSAVAAEYGIQSIPQNFLIDPSGKIIGHNLRGPELQQTLETTLK